MAPNQKPAGLPGLGAQKERLEVILGTRLKDMSARQARELAIIIAPLVALFLGAIWLASQFVQPAPPKRLTIATGGEQGAYYAFGMRYAAVLKRHGVELDVRATAGSIANAQLVSDAQSGVSVALMQGGITNTEKSPGLVSLGRVFIEPLWVFYRGETTIDQLHHLRGKRIAIGPDGSGTRRLATALLEANEIDANGATLLPAGGQAAVDGLTSGDIDAVFLTLAPEAPLIQSLLRRSDVKLMNFAQAEAYTRRFAYLQRIVLPQGAIDLVRNLPANDVTLVAPVAAMVARQNLHPALAGLLIEAMREVHAGGGLFQRVGDFPRPLDPEFEMSEDAARYYTTGPNWLRRNVPFWLANFIERMVLVAVPLAGVLLPVLKAGPAIYRWRSRRRLLYWYGRLKALESTINDNEPVDELRAQHEAILAIDEAVAGIPVPLGFSDQYYDLRAAIDLVRQRLTGRIATQNAAIGRVYSTGPAH